MKRMVKCPHCGREAEYSSENKFRPFCSERCRLIDLGAWADEAYRVPVSQQNEIYQEMLEEDEDLKKFDEND